MYMNLIVLVADRSTTVGRLCSIPVRGLNDSHLMACASNGMAFPSLKCSAYESLCFTTETAWQGSNAQMRQGLTAQDATGCFSKESSIGNIPYSHKTAFENLIKGLAYTNVKYQSSPLR